MVGREVLFRLEKEPCRPGAPVLEVEEVEALNDKNLPALREVSLTLHAGEIVGIAGVAGNGQRELAEVITGLRTAVAGEIRVNETCVTNCSPLEMIRAGVSHVPEDRVGVGLVGSMPVSDNLALKGYRGPELSRGPVLLPGAMQRFARRLIESFDIATPGPETSVKFLSGGNLQKTILARELTACGGLLVAVHPTRGLDVGATEAVRRLLLEQRNRGNAVLLISEDLDELLAVSDRIAVMFEGQIVDVVPAADADVAALGLMMAGGRPEAEGVAR
jgi:simple sugar transport system ATP-binding protein